MAGPCQSVMRLDASESFDTVRRGIRAARNTAEYAELRLGSWAPPPVSMPHRTFRLIIHELVTPAHDRYRSYSVASRGVLPCLALRGGRDMDTRGLSGTVRHRRAS